MKEKWLPLVLLIGLFVIYPSGAHSQVGYNVRELFTVEYRRAESPDTVQRVGEFMPEFNNMLSPPGGFAVSKDLDFFICDRKGRLAVFDKEGDYKREILCHDGEKRFYPEDVKFGMHGEIFVLDTMEEWIYKFDARGDFLAKKAVGSSLRDWFILDDSLLAQFVKKVRIVDNNFFMGVSGVHHEEYPIFLRESNTVYVLNENRIISCYDLDGNLINRTELRQRTYKYGIDTFIGVLENRFFVFGDRHNIPHIFVFNDSGERLLNINWKQELEKRNYHLAYLPKGDSVGRYCIFRGKLYAMIVAEEKAVMFEISFDLQN